MLIHAEETGQVSGVTPVAVEVGDDPTTVVEVAFMTCQLMQCTLGGTSVEQPQNYLQKVLKRPSFTSSLLLALKLCRYPLGQSRHSHDH
jgi:hypothetical protein